MSLGRSVSAASMLGPTKVSLPFHLTTIKMVIMLLMEQVVRRVDRPRPLKLSAANRLSALELSSVEDVVVLMENVCRFLIAIAFDPAFKQVLKKLNDVHLLLQASQWEELRETSHQRTAQVSHFWDKTHLQTLNFSRKITNFLQSLQHLEEIGAPD